MKLITKDIEKKLLANPLYSGDSKPDNEREILVKFFTPDSNWTWYVLEANRIGGNPYELNVDNWEFFGLVDGFEKELGYFRLSDFEGVKGPMGLPIERDRHFEGYTLADVR